MARALIVGCGCRGRQLGERLLAEGWAVRGTSRREEGLRAIEAAGIEPALADPSVPGTVLDLIGDVAVVVWLLGSVEGSAEELVGLHGRALERVLERIVETPVRGFLYEAEGSVDPALPAEGREAVEAASARWRIPSAALSADPAAWADQVISLSSDRNYGNTPKAKGAGPMALQLGDVAPDFEADTTEGRIKFHDWIGDSWAVLFSHPKDFTPVCTTELGYMASIEPEFAKRGVKIIGLSIDPLDRHEEWAKDIEDTQGTAPNYPIISDTDFNVARLYGMLPGDVSGSAEDRTPADNQTVRNVFVIGPDKKIKLILVYPMTTGRNFDEVLRVIDSLQLTAKHKVATPVNWKQGEDVIIAGSVSDEDAKKTYPQGWKAPKPYIRIVPQPKA
jgi:thioredoxin-dependent peroxiredoxin